MMADVVMAYIVRAYIVMACMLMAYVVMATLRRWWPSPVFVDSAVFRLLIDIGRCRKVDICKHFFSFFPRYL